LSWIVGGGLFVILLWMGWSFRAGNAGTFDLDLVWIKVADVEIWRGILVSIGLGALGAAILVGFAWLRLRLLNRRYRSTIRKLEAELHQMRSLPLAKHAADAAERG
jgi:uncharacterized membrane protein YciS (DUF1049 family)